MTSKPYNTLKAMTSRHILMSAALALTVTLPNAGYAESLKEALTAAYLFNPTLKAARSQLRSIDNGVARAKSGYRPTITGQLQDGFEDTRTRVRNNFPAGATIPITQGGVTTPVPVNSFAGGSSANGVYNPRSATIALQQNIFDGFRTYNSVKGAEAQVEGGREDLRTAEENVLLNATTAYVNVVRDQSIVSLRQNNVRVLTEQLRATEDRFKVGEVTKTDVSQGRATLAGSQADLSIAQGTLFSSRAAFAQYIGHMPGTLKDPGPADKLIPKTLEKAISIGEAESPGILAAIFRVRAQEHVVKQTKGQLLPSVTLNASYTRSAESNPSIDQIDDTRVTGNVNIPIYEAGAVSAQIRAEIETLSQRRQQVDEQREFTRANVTSAWGQLIAARGNVASGQAQVSATGVSLEGVREEEKVGQRTILDVLSSEQQSLNAQVNPVSFKRDLVVASYSVLSAMGRLTAYDISLQAELYDPTKYYGEVKDAWYGWGASTESEHDPRVPQVTDNGRTPGQKSSDGPAYTQKLPPIP